MRIYHLLAQQQILTPTSGDRLNEISLLTALSRFAEVHYNQMLFKTDQESFGLNNRPIEAPNSGYDLYYVRNNNAIFKQLPHPKICLSFPYSVENFKTADAVVTYNDAWKQGLEQFNDDPKWHTFFCGIYPQEIVRPKRVINIGQVLDDQFRPVDSGFPLFRFKAKYGMGFTIGYFGRITEETLPRDYISLIPELKQKIPLLETVFAGSIRTEISDKSIRQLTSIPFDQMPSATCACDIVLANEQPEANWAGSVKPLEAMGCGVPILLTKRPSRVNQLGDQYPLFYNGRKQLFTLIIRLYEDKEFYDEVRKYLLERAQQFYPAQMAIYLKRILEDLLADIARNG